MSTAFTWAGIPEDSIAFDKAASDSLDAPIEIASVPAGGEPVVSLSTASTAP